MRLPSAAGWGVRLRQLLGVRLGRLHQYAPRPLCRASVATAQIGPNLPSIALVTPSFNQARFIASTVDSVLAQRYPTLHYVIQDAQSRDGTAEVLARYHPAEVEVRIEADSGQSDALNRGFACAQGEIMGYLNSDDLLLPGALHLVGQYFRDHPEVDVVYGNRLIVDSSGKEIGRWILPGHDGRVLRSIDYVPQETLFWRRRIWEAVGARFDATLQYAMDWDLLLRFLDAGAIFAHLPPLLGVFRVHTAQKTQAAYRSRGNAEMAQLRARHAAGAGSTGQRLLAHGRFLLAHRRADAQFRAGR